MSDFKWDEGLVREFIRQFATLFTPEEQETRLSAFKASKQPKQEWEILEGKQSDGSPHRWDETGPNSCERHNCKIHSVRRVSDGEVFTVGDAVEIEGAKRMRPIYRFSLDGDTLMVHFHEYASVSFNMISAAPKLATAVYFTPNEIEKLKQLLK